MSRRFKLLVDEREFKLLVDERESIQVTGG